MKLFLVTLVYLAVIYHTLEPQMSSKVGHTAELAHHQEGKSWLSSPDSPVTSDKAKADALGRSFEKKELDIFQVRQTVVAHAFNLSTREGETGGSL